jgi:hypothetical protein
MNVRLEVRHAQSNASPDVNGGQSTGINQFVDL